VFLEQKIKTKPFTKKKRKAGRGHQNFTCGAPKKIGITVKQEKGGPTHPKKCSGGALGGKKEGKRAHEHLKGPGKSQTPERKT